MKPLEKPRRPCWHCGRDGDGEHTLDSGRTVWLCGGKGGCATDYWRRQAIERRLDADGVPRPNKETTG